MISLIKDLVVIVQRVVVYTTQRAVSYWWGRFFNWSCNCFGDGVVDDPYSESGTTSSSASSTDVSIASLIIACIESSLVVVKSSACPAFSVCLAISAESKLFFLQVTKLPQLVQLQIDEQLLACPCDIVGQVHFWNVL